MILTQLPARIRKALALLVRALPLAVKVQILNKKANQTFPMVPKSIYL